MAKKAIVAEGRHIDEPSVDGELIVSGDTFARVVHNSSNVAIGDGEDGALWVLVHDFQRRPRGRDPGVVVELGEVHYEQNGLVRVVNRRIARESLERLVHELTGARESIGEGPAENARIPEGSYRGITVHHVDDHYRVQAQGAVARHLSDMQPLGPNRWLVMSSEESRLRRELVQVLMPAHHKLVWSAIRHGDKVLLATGVVLAGLSFVTSIAAPLAVVAAVGLGLFHWKRSAIIAFAHRSVVQPHIANTFEAVNAANDAHHEMNIDQVA